MKRILLFVWTEVGDFIGWLASYIEIVLPMFYLGMTVPSDTNIQETTISCILTLCIFFGVRLSHRAVRVIRDEVGIGILLTHISLLYAGWFLMIFPFVMPFAVLEAFNLYIVGLIALLSPPIFIFVDRKNHAWSHRYQAWKRSFPTVNHLENQEYWPWSIFWYLEVTK